jgi:Fe(3+) dicitrate transport protein
MRYLVARSVSIACLSLPAAFAALLVNAEESAPSRELPAVVIEGVGDTLNQVGALPPTQGTAVYSGKKTTSTPLETLPEVTTNNYRQVFAQTPGLLVSEVANESWASLSYRGLGDPHESFNIQNLKDELPVNADMYGYPAAYYNPPVESLERVDFIRGGAALMFGSQPGGALNYVSRDPSRDDGPVRISTKQVFGSESLYSTFNEIRGWSGDTGYLGYYHLRESDGFRSRNSDYRINASSARFLHEASSETRIKFWVDAYDAEHGEPGGLTLESGAGLANINEDRWQSTTPNDRLLIERYFATARLEHDYSNDGLVSLSLWSGYLSRLSRRQSSGGAPSFGGLVLGTGNTIQEQEFQTVAAEARLRQDFQLGGETHTLTLGGMVFDIDSPFSQESGSTVDAVSGTPTRRISRQTFAWSTFAENRFVWNSLSVTPGFRLDGIYQDIDELLNVGATVPLRSNRSVAVVPLFGLALAYDLHRTVELYANVSQAYKPIAFQDSIPLGPGDTVSEDIDEGNIVNYEVGMRGTPFSWARFDTSAFLVTYDNQFGRDGTQLVNTGAARHYGVDLGTEIDMIGFLDKQRGTDWAVRVGKASLYYNASLLNAEFTSGPFDGKTPQYAPDYLMRGGLMLEPRSDVKVALLGTFLSSHFADDSNSANRFIPSYRVWDLTADVDVWNNQVSLVAGINNLFDEKYYARIRGNGIEPGNPRNYYLGVEVRL